MSLKCMITFKTSLKQDGIELSLCLLTDMSGNLKTGSAAIRRESYSHELEPTTCTSTAVNFLRLSKVGTCLDWSYPATNDIKILMFTICFGTTLSSSLNAKSLLALAFD